MLKKEFFDRDANQVAQDLLGKVIYRKYNKLWLKVRIIETEAYLKEEKASHASLGFTKKRKALFMPPGTIYMYYARGKDSLNVSVGDEGDAVLIKAGVPYLEDSNQSQNQAMIKTMKKLNPINGRERETKKLCSGQTLLAKSISITVDEWDQKQFHPEKFYIKDVGYKPEKIIKTTRLGIPKGRDEHLMYRYIDYKYRKFCTKNPITRNAVKGEDYKILS